MTCPDLISLIDPATAEVVSGRDITGRETAVIGIKTADIWRTPQGLELLTPKYFGFDIEYRPIEEIMKRR